MKEFVKANGRTFACREIKTRINAITLVMENQDRDELEAFFRGVTGCTVHMEGEEKPHGIYTEPDFVLRFHSIATFEDGSVAITMRILTEQEMDLAALKESQAEQDELLAELMFGN